MRSQVMDAAIRALGIEIPPEHTERDYCDCEWCLAHEHGLGQCEQCGENLAERLFQWAPDCPLCFDFVSEVERRLVERPNA